MTNILKWREYNVRRALEKFLCNKLFTGITQTYPSGTFVLLLILKIYPSFRSDYLFMNNSGFFFTDAVLG
jgi:hypothetical protein